MVNTINTDINSNRYDCEKLNDLTREQKLLLNNVNTQIWFILDPVTHGKANQARCDFLGVSKSDIEFKNYYDLYEKKEAHQCVIDNRKIFNEKQVVKKEVWVKDYQGQKHCLFLTKNPVINKEGEVEFIVCSATNITEQKLAEAKIQEYTNELEQTKAKLENLNHKLDQEINKAKKIHQQTLTKEKLEIDRFSVVTHYLPARNVGGDFYDILLHGDKLIAYVSDVTGHGLDAAMLSSFIKSTIKSFVAAVPEESLTPTKIVKFLAYQYQQENYPEDYFICIFMIVLDLNTNKMLYTGLGLQDTPLLSDGNVDKNRLLSKGLPISKSINLNLINFESKKINFNPGYTLIMNTDGITEQKNKGEYYIERYQKTFYQNSHLTPGKIKEKLKKDFYEFNGKSHQGDDDITFLILHYNL